MKSVISKIGLKVRQIVVRSFISAGYQKKHIEHFRTEKKTDFYHIALTLQLHIEGVFRIGSPQNKSC